MAQIQHPVPVTTQRRYEWLRYVILSLLLVSIFFLANTTRQYIQDKSRQFQAEVIDQIEDAFDVRIQYASISPTFWGWFHINNVEVFGKGMHVSAQRLTVHFDAWRMLLGSRDITLITKIDLNRVSADIEQLESLERERPEASETPALTLEESFTLLSNSVFGFLREGMNMPELNLELSLRNVSVSYRADWGLFQMSNLLFTIEPTEDLYQIELIATPELTLANELYVALPLRISGRVNRDLLSGDLRFDVTNPYRHIINVEQQGMRVQWRDGVLEVRKSIDVLPLDYGMRIDAIERSIQLGFSAYQFTPSQFISGLSTEAASLVSYVDGSGSLLYYPDIGLLYYGLSTQTQMQMGEHHIRLSADATGNRNGVNIRRLHALYQEQSYLEFAGTIDWTTGFPDGSLEIFWQGAKDQWGAQLEFIDRQNLMQVSSKSLRYNGKSLGVIDSVIYPISENFKTFLRFNPNQAYGDFAPLLMSGFFNVEKKEAEATLDLHDFSLNGLIDAGLVPEFLREWQVNSQIYFDWKSGDFMASVRDLEMKKDEQRRINFSVTANKERVEIQNLSLFWDNYFAKLRLTSEFSTTPQFFGEVTSSLTDYAFTGDWNGERILIANDYGQVQFDTTVGKALMLIEDMPLRDSLGAPRLNVHVEADLTDGWRVMIPLIKVEGEDLFFQVTNGEIGANGGSLGRMRYRDEFAELYGSLRYNHQNGVHDLRFSMASDDLPVNREVHLVELRYDGDLHGKVSLTRFPLPRLHVPGLEGVLHAQIDINEVIKGQDVTFDIQIPRGFYQDNVIRGGVVGRYTPVGLSFSQLSVQYGENLLSGGTILANFNDWRFVVAGQYSQVNRNLKAGFAFDFAPEGSGDGLSFGEVLQAPWLMKISFDPLYLNDRVMLAGSRAHLTHREGVYRLDGLNRLDLRAEVDTNTQLGYLFWRGTGGLVVDTVFNLDEDNFLIDVQELAIPLGLFNPYFTKSEGARVVGFDSGRIYGNLQVTKGGVLSSGELIFSPETEISLLNLPKDKLRLGGAMITINDNQLMLSSRIDGRVEPRMEIEAGSGLNRVILELQAKASLGEPSFSYEAELLIRSKNKNRADKNGLVYEISVGSLINLQGRVSGNIHFDGDTTGARLSGDLYLVSLDGNFGALSLFMNDESIKRRRVPTAKNPKPGFLVQASSREDERFTPLKIRTGNSVNFYVPPAIELLMANEQELVLVLDVQRGAPVGQNQIYLEGDLGIRRGEVRAFNNTFRIRDGGMVSFSEEYGFNPMLKFAADFKTDDGHIITVEYEDQPIGSSLDFDLTSPTLEQAEIMQYLGMKFMPSIVMSDDGLMSSGMGDEGEEVGANTEDASKDTLKTVLEPIGNIAEQYLARQLERAFKFIPFVDTVTIRTNMISNLALSQFGADGNTETSSWLVGNNAPNAQFWDIFDQTSISAGFRVTSFFTIEGTFGMARMPNQQAFFGEAEQLLPNLGVNLNFDTPFFLINWSFTPTLARQSIDQLFVANVSIGINKVFRFRDWEDFLEQWRRGAGA
ncbi:translocation/assembly module TamB domain-containing protein [Entomospira culicis]|uniref:Translocation and assembly module TamB C-terminal domain-containing protein n=1 Tax=Entomospira culicis TaxID=2719989 RepID=A0A968KZP0_9SPIO|nr:translocation/assembly module TamB domain-containing protein [Entomospira culicis]NIZ19564.1 hypothetical protein [Entomospira culicis]NIZ69531.1 hypothetical protein [Entomospira culicis]WDI36644.1 translocation/assembly module TamB domain-containing protein [Entomospira culicis]WDI38273.1 translocation/assembly module TamB domain-containing protein [Entomospira culicis]